ncbi:MAG: ROK family protein [Vibrio sp.]
MYIGLDIGGTKIEVCVLTHSGETKFKQRTPTPKTYEQFVEAVVQSVFDAERAVGAECKVGIGLPGAISPATGLIKNANCLFLNGKDLKADLENALNRTVEIANDANSFALSEAVDGAGKDGNVVFGAILGTGCGGGLVVNKKVLNGANAIAGEWGHNPLPYFDPAKDGEPRRCYCGRQNCTESYISGTGFELSYQLKTGTKLSAPEIMALVEQKDPIASECYQTLVDQMARSFAVMINLIDPDVIVLGGGLSNIESLYQDLPKATLPYIFTDFANLNFKRAEYGDSSGIRGAAWLSL